MQLRLKQKTHGKSIAATIALILMFAMPVLLVETQSVQAFTYATYCYVSAYPSPVGVGQTLNVVMWISEYPPFLITPDGARVIGGDTWKGMQLIITHPDGTTETMGPYNSDTMGSHHLTYSPTTAGTYKFQMTYPGQTYPASQGGDTYKGSESAIWTVTVQEEPVATLGEGVLPSGYWQHPINAENRAWASFAGNWLMPGYDFYSRAFDGGSAFNPYTTAPNTAHIVWTKPIMSGGLIGSPYGSDTYYQGSSYEIKMTPPVIMNGKLYYSTGWNPSRGSVPPGFTCVDIRTGETLYTADIDGLPINNAMTLVGDSSSDAQYGVRYPGLAFGQTLMFNSVNQFGGFTYLWALGGSGANMTLDMYDAFTGQHWLRFVNVTSGLWTIEAATPAETGGAVLDYVYDPIHGWIALWNSTRAILRSTPTALGTVGTVPNVDLYTAGAWYWRPPYDANLDWNYGIEWNTTIPIVPLPPAIGGIARSASFLGGSQPFEGVLIASVSYPPEASSTTGWPTIEFIGYDATTGAFLWAQNHTDLGLQSRGGHITPFGNGVFCMWCAETQQWYGYSIRTGAKVWGPTAPDESCWGYYNSNDMAAYGILYGSGIDGIVHAYNISTGELLWEWSTGTSGFETPYPNYPLYGGTLVADGKLYLNEGTHGNGAGLWKGNTMSCVDANTGDLIWRIAGWFDGATIAVADGYLIGHNYYDNQIYSFGKGQTAVTVSAPETVQTLGTDVLIKGTVTDQSPGQTCLGIPAAGTPAISDESMSAWMEYLYMQKPMPTNATGVTVTLDVIDSNGNYRNIGTVTSDQNGMYSLVWKPDIPGQYTIIATFAGSESYFSSYAETFMDVSEAQPTPTPTPLTLPPYETYTIAATIAIIIAVAIVGILLLRKRP
jgi:outer membrane protein assembly factor BamB